MFNSQIKSLERKMYDEKTAGANNLAMKGLKEQSDKEKAFDKWLDDYMKGK